MLRFLIDEDCPKSLETLLTEHGHDAIHVWNAQLSGTKDPELFLWAQQHQRIIVSRDLGWANILTYPVGSHHGLLILRAPFDYTATQIRDMVARFLTTVDLTQIPGHLTIIDPNKVRIKTHS